MTDLINGSKFPKSYLVSCKSCLIELVVDLVVPEQGRFMVIPYNLDGCSDAFYPRR